MQYEFKHTFLGTATLLTPTLVLPGNSRRYGLIYAAEAMEFFEFYSGAQGYDGQQWFDSTVNATFVFNYQDFGPLLQAEIWMTRGGGLRATLTEILQLL